MDRSLQITRRFSHLEQQLKSAASVPMLREVFPETEYAAHRVAPLGPISSEQELANIGCLLTVMTLMEDTIAACDLQTHWRHPMNLGWVNLFARWATAPTFQKWWQLLKPLYGPGLRNFLEDRFEVLRDSPAIGSAAIAVFDPTATPSHDFALEWWRTRHGTRNFAGRTLYQYSVSVLDGSAAAPVRLQFALVAIEFSGATASWTSDHFFVPLSLWGSKLAVHFLSMLLQRLKSNGWQTCIVKVKGPSDLDNNQAKWDESQIFVNFYRQAGFRLEGYEPYQESIPTGGTRNGLWAILSIDLP